MRDEFITIARAIYYHYITTLRNTLAELAQFSLEPHVWGEDWSVRVEATLESIVLIPDVPSSPRFVIAKGEDPLPVINAFGEFAQWRASPLWDGVSALKGALGRAKAMLAEAQARWAEEALEDTKVLRLMAEFTLIAIEHAKGGEA